MIHGISGKPGGGKSYEAVVSHIIPIVSLDKRKVVTNLPLNVEHFCAVYGEFCRDLIEVVDGQFHNYGGERPFSKKDHYVQYEDWQNEKGQKVYFFIDECHLAMGTQGTEKQLTEFYSMHRHYGFDIMLITQNFRKVNRDIKDMVGNHYRAIKKSMIGQDDKYILKVHDGASSTNQSVVATHERVYESKFFKFYQSHTKSETSVEEAGSNDIELWYKHWTIKLGVFFLVLVIFALFSLLSGDDDIKNNVKSKKVESTELSTKNLDEELNQITSEASSNKEKLKSKSPRIEQYDKMVSESSSFHPFYKLQLHITGSAEYMDGDYSTRTHYFSASQNGQHIFELKSADLMLAGYSVQILSDCIALISYYDYEDFITCDSPSFRQAIPAQTIVMN